MKNFVITYHERRDHREFIWETQAESETEATKKFYDDPYRQGFVMMDIEEGKWDRVNYKVVTR